MEALHRAGRWEEAVALLQGLPAAGVAPDCALLEQVSVLWCSGRVSLRAARAGECVVV
jgi:pentatricopeptide repeat protein